MKCTKLSLTPHWTTKRTITTSRRKWNLRPWMYNANSLLPISCVFHPLFLLSGMWCMLFYVMPTARCIPCCTVWMGRTHVARHHVSKCWKCWKYDSNWKIDSRFPLGSSLCFVFLFAYRPCVYLQFSVWFSSSWKFQTFLFVRRISRINRQSHLSECMNTEQWSYFLNAIWRNC